MDQKTVVVLNSLVAAGFVAMGIILCVRMPQEATADAFTCLVNASARGTLAIAETSAC